MAAWSEQDGVFTLIADMLIHAPIERCFALSCSIKLVHEELGMDAVEGRTSGLVQPGDTIRWEGWQLGMRHFHVSYISGFKRPVFLQDTMVAGRFRSFQHDHSLRELAGGITELHDELRFALPYGILGKLVARYIMVPHILRLMHDRFHRIRRITETDAWRRYLCDEAECSIS